MAAISAIILCHPSKRLLFTRQAHHVLHKCQAWHCQAGHHAGKSQVLPLALETQNHITGSHAHSTIPCIQPHPGTLLV